MSLTEAQKRAAHAGSSVAVLAGAGTGKTYLLTHRYLHHLKSGLSPLQIVATTFTDSAASELRSRIRTAVREEHPHDAELQAQLEIAPISTMHGLCQQICREYPSESELPAGFSVTDETDQLLWFERHYPALLSRLPEHLFRYLPYSQLDSVLRVLLADPYQSEISLQVTRHDRIRLLEELSKATVEGLRTDMRAWLARLRPLAQPGVADSTGRAQAAYTSFAERFLAAEDPEEIGQLLLEMAETMTIRKSKAWDETAYEAVKGIVTDMRGRARLEKDTGLLTSGWGEADDLLEEQLAALGEAFTTVNQQLRRLRQQERIATFDDLELGALRALGHEEIRAELSQRWRAFMIDEFQDTNPVQLQLIRLLTNLGQPGAANLTTVGDVKQSIYGFRRAAPELSSQLAEQLDENVELGTSFRSHNRLLAELDPLFRPLLSDLHQTLQGHRTDHPEAGPFLEVIEFREQPGSKRAEARHLARKVRALLDAGEPVWDKRLRSYRPLEHRDVAVLVRTQNSLPDLLDAFAEAGLPTVHTAADDLLSTSEAQDASSLLSFLNNPLDDLALLTLLRSPFFTVSDRTLALMAGDRNQGTAWWTLLRESQLPDTGRARQLLLALLDEAENEKPVRLLQLADRLSGYTAVLAGLNGSQRRLADWQGFLDFVLRLQNSGAGLSGTVRSIRELKAREIQLPRPQLEAGNAISFMTIHKSKGLEWPLVIVPDISRRGGGNVPPAALLDDNLGCALYGADKDEPKSLSWGVLTRNQKERQDLEDRRVLYVAATRAADRLIVSGGSYNTGLRKALLPAMEQAELPVVEPEEQQTDFGAWSIPAVPTSRPMALPVMADAVAPVLSALPVTALAYYDACPRRFEYRQVHDHPGSQPEFAAADGSGEVRSSGYARRIGDLTHAALEHGITHPDELARRDPGLDRRYVDEALELASNFLELDVFAPAREQLAQGYELEAETEIRLGDVSFRGRVDALTGSSVLDYKTDRHPDPDRHVMQLALYAHANQVDSAMLAYLRRGELHVFNQAELTAAHERATGIADRIRQGEFSATPGEDQCRICEYNTVCEFAWRP